MSREIVHIPAKTRTDAGKNTQDNIRVAAYCRVSTEQEEQLGSFENQVTYYTEYITNHPDYVLAGIYADEGISGTSTRHREQFMRMIEDCEAGKIDLVITKSISRFARNTQDCLNYSRKLKDLGIGVMFEKEGINTMDSAGELLFTILSSLAQDESRSISENSQWGIRALFKQGRIHLNTNRFYGYDKDENFHLVINPEQGKVVHWIYESYMDGYYPDAIARKLNESGVKTCTGTAKWTVTAIMSILTNEKHMGDCILQKSFTVDYLTKKMVKNEGQLEQYYIRDDHEPIVSKEIWNAVQMEIERRRDFQREHGVRSAGRKTEDLPFSNKVFCGTCGKVFWRRTIAKRNVKNTVWMCANRYQEKGVIGCTSGNLREFSLYDSFQKAWNTLIDNRKQYLPKWKEMAEGDNALMVFRAKQFIELTKSKAQIDGTLVCKVLEYCTVGPENSMTFFFMDGTVVEVEI